MPANLPPQYVSAEERYRSAKDPEEKIAILEEMWSLLPKHKGTDKIQADLKRRLSKLKEQAEKGGARRKGFSISIPREGAGQVVVLGPVNTGKSSVVAALTNASLKIAPWPFTTALPCPAMMPWRDVRAQLVDLPPIAPGAIEFWLMNIIRNADAAILVADISSPDCLEGIDMVRTELNRRMLGIGGGLPLPERPEGYTEKRAILVANKADLAGAADMLAALRELYAGCLAVEPFSCVAASAGEREAMRDRIFSLLRVIRIYPKEPGARPDLAQPFTVPEGSTVLAFAAHVHKDFARGLKQARVWGSARFGGQAVSRDHVLRDEDIVELSL